MTYVGSHNPDSSLTIGPTGAVSGVCKEPGEGALRTPGGSRQWQPHGQWGPTHSHVVRESVVLPTNMLGEGCPP